MAWPKTSKEVLEQIREWRAEGVPIKLIARRVGRSISSVSNLLSRHRLVCDRATLGDKIKRLHQRGYSAPEIAEEVGLSLRAVVDWKRRLGLKTSTKMRSAIQRRNGRKVARLAALDAGWPAARGPGEARLLQLLYDCPGAYRTVKEIAAALQIHEELAYARVRYFKKIGVVVHHHDCYEVTVCPGRTNPISK